MSNHVSGLAWLLYLPKARFATRLPLTSVIRTFLAGCVILHAVALPYTPGYEDWNLNQNVTAETPLDYWGTWPDHSYHASPRNWRMPFYTLFLDRFVNGDPSNDNANGTMYEHDSTSSILRHGGDITGLADSLDYLQGKTNPCGSTFIVTLKSI